MKHQVCLSIFTFLAVGLPLCLAQDRRSPPDKPAQAAQPGAPPVAPADDTLAELDAKIVQLSHPGATTAEVTRLLGEPKQYVWGRERFTKNNLPEIYLMQYALGVQVVITDGLVSEFRSERPGPGFSWQGKLRLGSSLEEALEVLGPPAQTVAGIPIENTASVLYKDIPGRPGVGYYSRPDHHVRLFFMKDKVSALYVTVDPAQEGKGLQTTRPTGIWLSAPAVNARINQLDQPGITSTNVIRMLGEPIEYAWENQTLDKAHLPKTYAMVYPMRVSVVVTDGVVDELRCEHPEPGFTWHGRLRTGSSVDEALAVLGAPSRTVVGQPVGFVPGVLYKDIGGKPGRCYYHRPDHRIRLFFRDNKVNAIYFPLSKKTNGTNTSEHSR